MASAQERVSQPAKRKQSRTDPKAADASQPVERRAVSLPADLVLEVDSARFSLRKRNRRVSFSALVEAALRELLSRDDMDRVLDSHGASARRGTRRS